MNTPSQITLDNTKVLVNISSYFIIYEMVDFYLKIFNDRTEQFDFFHITLVLGICYLLEY